MTELLYESFWTQWCSDTQALLAGLPDALKSPQQATQLNTVFERWLLELKVRLTSVCGSSRFHQQGRSGRLDEGGWRAGSPADDSVQRTERCKDIAGCTSSLAGEFSAISTAPVVRLSLNAKALQILRL